MPMKVHLGNFLIVLIITWNYGCSKPEDRKYDSVSVKSTESHLKSGKLMRMTKFDIDGQRLMSHFDFHGGDTATSIVFLIKPTKLECQIEIRSNLIYIVWRDETGNPLFGCQGSGPVWDPISLEEIRMLRTNSMMVNNLFPSR